MLHALSESAVRSGCRQALAIAVHDAIFPARFIVVDLHIFGGRVALQQWKSIGSDKSRQPG